MGLIFDTCPSLGSSRQSNIMNTPTPEMITKLPKWAQTLLEDYKRRCSNAEDKLSDLLDNTTETKIYAKVHTLNIGDRYFIPSDEVTFILAPREEISIRIEDGHLHCMGSGSVRTQLIVKPRVTNVIDLCLE